MIAKRLELDKQGKRPISEFAMETINRDKDGATIGFSITFLYGDSGVIVLVYGATVDTVYALDLYSAETMREMEVDYAMIALMERNAVKDDGSLEFWAAMREVVKQFEQEKVLVIA